MDDVLLHRDVEKVLLLPCTFVYNVLLLPDVEGVLLLPDVEGVLLLAGEDLPALPAVEDSAPPLF